jgi:hypothetical protein
MLLKFQKITLQPNNRFPFEFIVNVISIVDSNGMEIFMRNLNLTYVSINRKYLSSDFVDFVKYSHSINYD